MENLFSNEKEKVYIWGTGSSASKLIKTLEYLEVELECLGFIDNNNKLWGETFHGLSIQSPDIIKEEIENRNNIKIIIASSFYSEIKLQLLKYGLKENIDFYNEESLLNKYNFNMRFKNGHFYSPIPDVSNLSDIKLYTAKDYISGINLNKSIQQKYYEFVEKQIEIFSKGILGEKFPRFYLNNNYFEFFDGLSLFSMLKLNKPNYVIEVGSGYSSSLFLDTSEFLKLDTEFIFIEPYPENRLSTLLSQEDKTKTTIWDSKVQEITLDKFDILNKGDILFIDSSHVSKRESDVNYLLFKVLPRLRKGVIIHIHDIFYPFEYPLEWTEKGVYWNEAYLLRSFLSFNDSFEIVFWNDFIYRENEQLIRKNQNISSYINDGFGSSMWIKKIK